MKEKLQKATHTGELHIGDMNLPCYVLEDGTRLLAQTGTAQSLGMSRFAQLSKFTSSNVLKPFINKELTDLVNNPIIFMPPGGGRIYGYQATILTDICDAVLEARKNGKLLKQQEHIAAQCEILTRAFARIGIIALVDEATGYQEIRDKKALAAILDKYLRKELAAWAKRFPDEFYKEMFRLRGWNWSFLKRPAYVGRLTNDVIYERIAPGLLAELKKRSPVNEQGKRKGTLQQLFTDDIGHPALAQHLHAVTGLMRAGAKWDDFYRLLQRAFPKKNEQLPLLKDD